MKLVDEKGKLFGKINIVDLLVILLVVVVAVVLGMKFLGGGTPVGDGQPKPTLTYTVKVTEVDPVTYENVCQFVDKAAGKKDQLLASGSLLEGYIIDVAATEHIPTAADKVGGETLDLVFTVQVVTTDSLVNAVGTQEVRIGKTHILKSQHLEFEEGLILTCSWDS